MYDFTACIVTYNTAREDLEKVIGCFRKTELNFKLWISDNSRKRHSEKIYRRIR